MGLGLAFIRRVLGSRSGLDERWDFVQRDQRCCVSRLSLRCDRWRTVAARSKRKAVTERTMGVTHDGEVMHRNSQRSQLKPNAMLSRARSALRAHLIVPHTSFRQLVLTAPRADLCAPGHPHGNASTAHRRWQPGGESVIVWCESQAAVERANSRSAHKQAILTHMLRCI